MTAYAAALLHNVKMGPEIVAYLQKIDDTLAPFGGHFIIHGSEATVLEGVWPADLVVIAFPDMERARNWYASPAYQAILHLRTDNSEGGVVLLNGVDESHKATDILG
ncbi:DUF1330 domain-containing protein [Phyllobacterium salinisoli]|uniref:DUF1330 domain-containing protein n=1 Tax=Phyllobacterium salinisoli TaxID=1899321 RepID=A0A368K4J7_9HYPH|nr:DUF1330 domain-containing protein [Phyllobacterium salinisoli]RCS23403.1 DUF1330 domain-containing protein [Phyllobacterium salinisoli]